MRKVKKFSFDRTQIKPLAEGRGSCIATDRITVGRQLVGYMYREFPSNRFDSGWRFFAGDETQEYADQPEHYEIYDVNTIANHDPEIVPFLDSPMLSAFERRPGSKGFVRAPFPDISEH
jgi:hypothetical protein